MKIGIIGAMDVEVAKLKADMDITRTVEKASMEFCEGTLNGKDVVVVKCGIGKVAAGVCTQILCDLFDVTHVINTGIAGSLDAKIDIGDIVVSEEAVYHDVDVTVFGYPLGQQAGLHVRTFPADKHLIAAIKEAGESITHEVTKNGETVADHIHMHFGTVCSGDQFIGDDAKKAWIKENFDGLCAEMEGTSIAHTCYLNHIPYVIIRAISDKADGSAEMNYPEFEARAAQDCANITEQVLKVI